MKKGNKSLFGRIVAWIHLWPSLVSAIVLILVCLSGTIIVYCDEICELSAGDATHVKHVGKERVPIQVIIANIKKIHPKRRAPGYAVIYKDPTRSIKLNSFDRKQGLCYIFADPYTGEILKEDYTANFFYIMAHFHASFLWRGIGTWIVAICTIIFLIELITGLILWWPAKWTKTTREQSFKVKWNAKFKRLNYDLHNVLGFYALSVCLILTVTGLVIEFRPLANLTQKIFNGQEHEQWEESLPKADSLKSQVNIQNVIAQYWQRLPDKKVVQLSTYGEGEDGYYTLGFARHVGLRSTDGLDYVVIDRYTGAQIPVPAERIKHELVNNTYWAMHMGTYFGWLGKLLTFTGGLIATSLPITGFYIWWGRRKKKKKPTAKPRPDGNRNIPAEGTGKPKPQVRLRNA